MQNLSDNDIDKLFKQAADQQQPQFDAADWQEMAKRLDNQSDAKPSYYYKTWTGAVIVLGVAVLLSWLTINQGQDDRASALGERSSSHNTTSSADNKTGTQHADVFSIGNADSISMEIQHRDSAPESSQVASSGDTFNDDDQLTKVDAITIQKNTTALNADIKLEINGADNKSGNKVIKSSNSTNKTIDQPGVQKTLAIEKDVVKSETNRVVINNSVVITEAPKNASEKSITLTEISNSELSGSSVESNNVDRVDTRNQSLVPKTLNNADEKIDRVVAVQMKSNPVVIDDKESATAEGSNNYATRVPSSITLNEKDSVKKSLVVKKEDKKLALAAEQKDSTVRKSSLSRLALKVTGAPDFSSDRFKSVDKTGWNYGLMLEYFIAEKFSISAGAIWSRKFYSANEVKYSGYQADRVYGDCRMWDIPVNITYYVSPARSYSLFVTAGASSYLMNEENYDYQVETNYGTYTYSDQIVKENKEWFKTMNLSVGLQKQVNRKLALQVEPFIKIPLSGVGEGKIALASFGSFLSLQYKFRAP